MVEIHSIQRRPAAVRRVWAILSVFETGKPVGDYGALALLADGAGFSYGAHQGTDRSGTLDVTVRDFLDAVESRRALCSKDDEVCLTSFAERLAEDETTQIDPKLKMDAWPSWARDGGGVLQRLGRDLDSGMQDVQDDVFSRMYFEPALREVVRSGARTDLAVALLYDTAIQSGPAAISRMRNLFPAPAPIRGGDEDEWVLAYIAARRRWLLGRGGVVATTVYRMDAMLELARGDVWYFNQPFGLRMPKSTVAIP